MYQIKKDLDLKLQSLPKDEVARVLSYLVDHSFGLQEIYHTEYGKEGAALLQSRMAGALARSKKGMVEEIAGICQSYPIVSLWLMRHFFGLPDGTLHLLSRDAVGPLLGADIQPDFRAKQLWFFLDILYQQGEQENFDYAVSMGTGLYFYVLSQWEKYLEADALAFESRLYDFFDGIAYQLEADEKQRLYLYRQVAKQLEKNRQVYQPVHAKKIKQLAKVLRTA